MIEFWEAWQPLIIVTCGLLMLFSLTNPFLIAIGIIMAVSLSPELPLGISLRIGDFVMLWGVVVVGLQALTGRKKWPEILNWRPWVALLAVEFIASVIGALQGTARFSMTDYSSAIFLGKSIEMFLLYVIIIWILDTPAKIRVYTWALLLGGALLGAYGANTRLSGDSVVVVDITGGPTYSLIALALMVPFILGASLWLTGRTKVRQASALLLVPIIYAFIFTMSRQAYIGAAVMVGIVIRIHKRRLLVWFIPLLFSIWLFPQVIPEDVANRAYALVSGVDERGLPVYSTRLNVWQYRVPKIFEVNPITGLGLASLPPGFLDSQYAIVLYYTGFVGLAAFLWFLSSFGKQAWWLYQSAPSRLGQALGLAGLGIVVGFAIAGLGGSPLVAVRSREMFVLLMAGIATYSMQIKEKEDEKPVN